MNLRPTGLVAATLILMLFTCGCSFLLPSQPDPTPSVTRATQAPVSVPTIPPPSGPPSTTWYLVSFHDGNATVPVIPGTTITAFFDGQDTVSGLAGCNQYTAPYTHDPANLTVGPPTTTRMSCDSPPGVMAQESLYLARLQEVRGYRGTGRLELTDARGGVVLTYDRTTNGTPVPAPLTGTTWYVHTIVNASGQTVSPRGLTTIRMVFGEDGHLYGNAGCNHHYGSYERTGDGSITIGAPQTTRIYCGIAGVMELEGAYLATLPRMTRYTVTGDTLRLTGADGKAAIACETTPPI